MSRDSDYYERKKAEDPDFLKKRAERARAWYRKHRAKKEVEDPQWLEERRSKQREIKRAELADPERAARRHALQNARHRERMATDPEYAEEKRRQSKARYHRRRAKDPEFAQASSDATKRRKFGLQVDEYDRLFENHDGLCAICRKPETHVKFGKVCALSIDHCHASGKVRDLLCSACNRGLGAFRDDVEVMRNAITYLEKHSTSS